MARYNRDYDRSERNTRHPAWPFAYRAFFAPRNVVKIEKIEDRGIQRLGGDKRIYLENGQSYLIEEKFNPRAYPRLPVELRHTWNSDGSLKELGWTFKNLECDYVAYTFENTLEFYFLRFPPLKELAEENADVWERYGKKKLNGFWHTLEDNEAEGYTTHMVYVPIKLLQTLIPSMKKVVVSQNSLL